MAVSQAFLQVRDWAVAEYSTLQDLLMLAQDKNSVMPTLIGDAEIFAYRYKVRMAKHFECVQGAHYYIYGVLDKLEKNFVFEPKKDGTNNLHQFELIKGARDFGVPLFERIDSFIDVIKPDENYYFKILATHLVRSYLPDFHDCFSKPIPATELKNLCSSIDLSCLSIRDLTMSKECRDSLSVGFNLYPVEVKGLLYALCAIDENFLSYDEMNRLDKKITITDNLCFLNESIEFNGIVISPNFEKDCLDLKLPQNIIEKIGNIENHIMNYEHVPYSC